jgi:hypothetical protein
MSIKKNLKGFKSTGNQGQTIIIQLSSNRENSLLWQIIQSHQACLCLIFDQVTGAIFTTANRKGIN